MNLLNRNMSLREAITLARGLGVLVEPVARTGEIVFSHPASPQRWRVNGRRHDAPRKILTMLRRVVKAQRNHLYIEKGKIV